MVRREFGPPRLLDLFCGAGGSAAGYSRAGFEVVGVDLSPQPRYPFAFHQADALDYLAEHWQDFDAIHASPPCQGYSIMHNLPWLRGRDYPLLILPTLGKLKALGKPYILENVMGARHGAKGLTKRGLEAHGLEAGWLCGTMFGLPFYRHRLFATNWLWLAPGHPQHRAIIISGHRTGARPGSMGVWPGNGAQREGVGVGHAAGWHLAAEAMGIDWMKREELTQAIPPRYTQFLGGRLMAALARDVRP